MLVVMAAGGCGGGADGPTQATPIEYPADVPFSGTAPAGATWYEFPA